MAENIHERVPFRLQWVRQGKVAWREDWVGRYGASRTHIPTLDEHIGFANFDLQRNDLPTMVKDAAGDPYVMAIRPYTEAELVEIRLDMFGCFMHPARVEAVFRDGVMRPLADLARTLDIVAYHGFMPAEDTPGLGYLRTFSPSRELTIEFPDGPEAGL
jgi:hypothetical protein